MRFTPSAESCKIDCNLQYILQLLGMRSMPKSWRMYCNLRYILHFSSDGVNPKPLPQQAESIGKTLKFYDLLQMLRLSQSTSMANYCVRLLLLLCTPLWCPHEPYDGQCPDRDSQPRNAKFTKIQQNSRNANFQIHFFHQYLKNTNFQI